MQANEYSQFNFLIVTWQISSTKFANKINANYGTSLPLPIHGIHPASQLGSYRQVASGITAAQPGHGPSVWVVRKKVI